MKTVLITLLTSFLVICRLAAVTPIDPNISVFPSLRNPSDNIGKLANVSTRALAGHGDAALIIGFVVNEGSRYVLIRAVGPTLERFGIIDFLRNPRLTLYDSTGHVIATAASWSKSFGDHDRRGLDLITRSVGAFELGAASDDAIIHRMLTPGAYTIVVSSDDAQIGTALAEVYASATYGY
jgi:hypothetical protein